MSIKLVGDAVSLLANKNLHRALNRPGVHKDFDVDLPALENRRTLAGTIKKYLKNGWDWNLYSPVCVAHFIEGPLRGERRLLDGDHRRHMFKISFPDKETIPGYEIEVHSVEEYHLLFAGMNWSNRRQAKAEEVFIHMALGKDPETCTWVERLRICGLSVFGSPDGNGTVGDLDGPNIPIGAFKKAFELGLEHVKEAVTILVATWPQDDRLQGEMLEAVALLLKYYPYLKEDRKVGVDFRHWLKNHVSIKKQAMAAFKFKKDGGAVHHRQAESLARGMLDEFRCVDIPGGSSLKWKKQNLSTAIIDNLIRSS